MASGTRTPSNPPQNGSQSPEIPKQDAITPSDIPSFPNISFSSPPLPARAARQLNSDEEDEEPATAISFQRSTSPTLALQRNKGAEYQKVGEQGIRKMHRFSLYETTSRFYLVGGDVTDRKFRILKIDRTSDQGELNIAEDEIVYTRKEMNQLLNAVDDGNKASGGLKLRCSAWGMLGFIRFTESYYMLLITKRSQVALLGGHYIYQIDGTELVSLTTSSSSRFKLDRDPEEARFVAILSNLDLSRSFYFSYSYDITRSLQHNVVQERQSLFQEQRALSLYGRKIYITVIARRSRFFAGARFLKRGANDLGYVANDVETEQIVSEMRTTSFHAPGPELYANPAYTSYVQHRGSIPLHWTQDSSGVTPKPDIELNLLDPFYSAAALHFDNLFERYGAPVYVLNLVKARERTPRESILLKEYTNAISYLNQFLPENKKIIYKAWDMSRASKSREQDVIGMLETIAKDVISKTGFFRNGGIQSGKMALQNGVARTNCIDCLDRTNAAQFVIGKCALGHQLQALEIIKDAQVDFDTEAVNVLSQMYHVHGDTIAIQYGGSHLVNTMATYRRTNQWTSHSRDMVESFKRYYNNSFLDRQRQEAYNLFLGNYTYAQGQPMLWDLSTDYYLHHEDPRAWSGKNRRSYTQWFTPHNLDLQALPQKIRPLEAIADKPLEYYDDYWLEYYRPLAISSFVKIFSYKLNADQKEAPHRTAQDGHQDSSPFRARVSTHEHEAPEKGSLIKGVTIAYSPVNLAPKSALPLSGAGLKPSLRKPSQFKQPHNSFDLREGQDGVAPSMESSQDKSNVSLWTMDQFVTNSLSPSVVKSEVEEYEYYINHPMKLPLVVSTELPTNPNRDLLSYIQSTSADVVANMHTKDDDIGYFTNFLDIADDPLTVTVADTSKKRYKAYRQFMKGKSLFKQQRVDI
ncbi:MAG: hypothetical protein LQ351_005626 [Letrouitia transgressa]|nr:MAG: hypothetical protein LQ351_005626 [Letrouitia transgressa]